MNTIYLLEHDTKYKHILNHIIKNKYPVYDPRYLDEDYDDYNLNYANYDIFIQSPSKLFNNGKEINLDEDISFDIKSIQISTPKYVCIDYTNELYYFTTNDLEKELHNKILADITNNLDETLDVLENEFAVNIDGNALRFIPKNMITEDLCMKLKTNVFLAMFQKL